MLDGVGAFILSEIFDPRYLGDEKTVVDRALDWNGDKESATSAWALRVAESRLMTGDAAKESVRDLLTRKSYWNRREGFDPLEYLGRHRFDATDLESGRSSLIVDLCGQYQPRKEAEPAEVVPVTDSHVHAGLAFSRRELARTLTTPTKFAYSPGNLQSGKVTVLAASLRFSIWVLNAWHTEHMSGRKTSPAPCATSWLKVINGSFWSRIRKLLDTPWEVQHWHEDGSPANLLYQELQELDTDKWNSLTPTDLPPIPDLLASLSGDGLFQAMDDARRHFTVNTIRAMMTLFSPITSVVGEGFAAFQERTLAAGRLRSVLFPKHDPSEHRQLSERTRQANSISAALTSYPSPFECVGLELRREIDAHSTVSEAAIDVLESVSKGWLTIEQVLKMNPGLKSFASPVSFQRPRPAWWSEDLSWSTRRDSPWAIERFGLRGSDLRHAQAWQALSYTSITAKGLLTARDAFNRKATELLPQSASALTFDVVVKSVDVSGTELRHPTWMYVSAIRWIRAQGADLTYTAHAGESFERGFSGLRTIGELYLGDDSTSSHPPSRIGHALALHAESRYRIAAQHRHQRYTSSPHRFTEMLFDLCYLFYLCMNDSHFEPSRSGVDSLIQELVKPSKIPSHIWADAFILLHTPDVTRQVTDGFRLGSHDTVRLLPPHGLPGSSTATPALGGLSPYDLACDGKLLLAPRPKEQDAYNAAVICLGGYYRNTPASVARVRR
ncbi:MAG: hypothetical protein LBV06_07915 [Propionibacteriaceae bacterium]|jgi:hypothetical protein|nr:hypothetical protein [Propionibacteriaceae bacterium]